MQIKLYEKQECIEERRRIARDIYDNFIMKELLAHSHVSTINLVIIYHDLYNYVILSISKYRVIPIKIGQRMLALQSRSCSSIDNIPAVWYRTDR